jgi:hypothetical protein
MSFDHMRYKDLRKEAKKRGLRRYSSLNKAQLIQYLTTEVHPLQPKTSLDSGQEAESTIASKNQLQTVLSESDLTLFPDTPPENLPVRQILCDDCLNILPSLPRGAFDCCIADPPFNVSKERAGMGIQFPYYYAGRLGYFFKRRIFPVHTRLGHRSPESCQGKREYLCFWVVSQHLYTWVYSSKYI